MIRRLLIIVNICHISYWFLQHILCIGMSKLMVVDNNHNSFASTFINYGHVKII